MPRMSLGGYRRAGGGGHQCSNPPGTARALVYENVRQAQAYCRSGGAGREELPGRIHPEARVHVVRDTRCVRILTAVSAQPRERDGLSPCVIQRERRFTNGPRMVRQFCSAHQLFPAVRQGPKQDALSPRASRKRRQRNKGSQAGSAAPETETVGGREDGTVAVRR